MTQPARTAAKCTSGLTHLRQTWVQASLPQCAAAVTEGPYRALIGSGWRAASGGSGGSSGGSTGTGGTAATARDRAAGYLRDKERRQAPSGTGSGDAAAAGEEVSPPCSRLAEAAAEFDEAQQAFLLSSPSGLGVGAEAAIAQAIKAGAFENLKGKGKPLEQEDHGAQFFTVDPLMQAVTRTMGVQHVRPQSLELRDELQRELTALRAQLAAELQAAVQDQAAGTADHSSSTRDGSAAASASAGWFGRWFGGSRSDAGSRASNHPRPTVASIRAGHHLALQHAAEQVRQLIKQYNSAVLSDKETFGAFWPLNPTKQLDWGAEVDAALIELESKTAAQQ